MIQKNKRKTAVVTGASGRIDAGIVTALHKAGFDVVIHYYQSQQKSEQLCAQLNTIRADSAYTLAANLSKADEVKRLSDAILNIFTQVDVLVNNASAFYPTPIQKANAEHWDDLMGTNALAPFLLTQALSENVTNCVVNIADIHGIKPLKNHIVYSTTKAALVMLTKSLALELAPRVRVNAICPGAILWHQQVSDDDQQNILAKVPLNKLGQVVDIAQSVLFLIDAAYITGQIINVDGGRSLNQ